MSKVPPSTPPINRACRPTSSVTVCVCLLLIIYVVDQEVGVVNDGAEVVGQEVGVVEDEVNLLDQEIGVANDGADVVCQEAGVVEDEVDVLGQEVGVIKSEFIVTSWRVVQKHVKITKHNKM